MTIDLGAPAVSSRLFIGYRAAHLAEVATDSEEVRAQKRTSFFNELGATFMPGTPLMQAPIGLSAYLPMVIDPPPGSGLPDEVAAIVYASRPVYDYFRQNSLSRRMYTHSHTAVFNMPMSVAQFPAPLDAPTTIDANGQKHQFSFLYPDKTIDWQAGATRMLFIVPAAPGPEFCEGMLERVRAVPGTAAGASANQLLLAVAEGFAALWLHSAQPLDDPAAALDLLPAGATLMRDLAAQQASVVGDSDPGVRVTGPAAFTFRFERRMELFG